MDKTLQAQCVPASSFLSKILRSGASLMAMMLLVVGAVSAQQVTVSGTVTDEATGEPLPGVNIAVQATNIGTSSDAEGHYQLRIPSETETLVFSFIGYETKTVPVEGRMTINVEMTSTLISGDELVVVGYSTQKKQDLTGSVSVANVEEMQKVADGLVTRQLQGQVSGVTVISSGQPGQAPSVRIRGVGNFGNTNPLYVVDGVPTQDINHLNSGDIESMQVLKDASAASIYGSRASNGVIIITTKKGRSGLNVNFNSRFGWEVPYSGDPWNILSPQEMADLKWVALENSGTDMSTYTDPLYGSGEPTLPDYIAPAGAMEDEVDHGNYYVEPYYTDPALLGSFNRITRANKEGTNWFQEIFNPAATTSNNLEVSGGSDNATYMASFNYLNQQGTLLRTYLERYTLRVNTQFDVSNKIRIGENLAYSISDNPQSGTLTEGSAIGMSYRQQPIIPVYDIRGNFAGNWGAPLGNAYNPVAIRERTRNNRGEAARLFGNIFAEIDALKNLTIRTNFGGSYASSLYKSFSFPTYENNENSSTNSYSEQSYNSTDWTWSNTATYINTFAESHNINVVLGTEANKTTSGGRGGTTQEYFSFDPDYVTLDTGSGTQTNFSYNSEVTLFSLFGRFDYNYDDRYLLSGTLRRDGSSRFYENQYGLFPAGSIGWRISNERFMEDISQVNNLQFRAGYGVMGNQLNVNPNNAFTLFGGNLYSTYYPINGGLTGITEGFSQQRIGNPGAKWERSINLNIGFNATLFDGMLEVDMDYYRKDIKDLLYNPELPGTSGNAAQPFVNVGNIENTGVDAAVTVRHQASDDLDITASLNVTTYNNEIVKIAEGVENFDLEGRRFGGGNPIIRNAVGHPISSFFGYQIEGFWNSQDEVDQANASAGGLYQEGAAPGRFRYADVNGDGVISAEDRTFLGNPHADFTYGLNLAANYKNFDLSMFFYGSQGNDVWNQVKWWTDFYASFAGAKSETALHDSWTPDNHDATVAIQENDGSFSTNGVPNSYYVEDGSYLRLRNLQVGYTLPSDMLTSIGLNRFRVYVQGANLFTLTGYSGPDPEIGGGTTAFGIDEGQYPTARQFMLGLDLQF